MKLNFLSVFESCPAQKVLVLAISVLFVALTFSRQSFAEQADVSSAGGALSTELEDIKKQVLQLNRELFILEEDLLFPASTQVAVFVSVDIGRFFKVDSVELKINDKNVAGFLYTDRQRKALEQGGIQQVYLGNLKEGQHQLTAIFTGFDGEGRSSQTAINHKFEKDDDVVMIELKIEDNQSSYRANVSVEEWAL
jgi:hypothetical protein